MILLCNSLNDLTVILYFLKCTYSYGDILKLIQFFCFISSYDQLLVLRTSPLNRGHKTKAKANLNGKWSIATYASTCRFGSRRCDLCLTKKYIIARANHKNLLDKRIELISKCHPRNKYILKNIK